MTMRPNVLTALTFIGAAAGVFAALQTEWVQNFLSAVTARMAQETVEIAPVFLGALVSATLAGVIVATIACVRVAKIAAETEVQISKLDADYDNRVLRIGREADVQMRKAEREAEERIQKILRSSRTALKGIHVLNHSVRDRVHLLATGDLPQPTQVETAFRDRVTGFERLMDNVANTTSQMAGDQRTHVSLKFLNSDLTKVSTIIEDTDSREQRSDLRLNPGLLDTGIKRLLNASPLGKRFSDFENISQTIPNWESSLSDRFGDVYDNYYGVPVQFFDRMTFDRIEDDDGFMLAVLAVDSKMPFENTDLLFEYLAAVADEIYMMLIQEVASPAYRNMFGQDVTPRNVRDFLTTSRSALRLVT